MRRFSAIPMVCALATLPLGAQTYTYDAGGRLTRATYPQGGGVRYQYDAADNLLSVSALSVPPAPTGVEVSRTGPSSVRITWSVAQGAAGYRVERRLAGGSAWQVVGNVGAGQLSFVDQGAISSQQYVYRVSALGADGAGAFSETRSTEDSSGLPTISQNGIVNAASFDPSQPIAPGSIVSVFGTSFGYTDAGGQRTLLNNPAGAPPLPIELAGHRVTIGGRPAPLFYVAGRDENGQILGQVNAQVPWQTSLGDAVPVSIRRATADGFAESEVRTVRVARVSPALFTFSFGGGRAAIVNVKVSPNDDVIDASIAQPVGSLPGAITQPARPGGVISIYATGLGPVTPVVRDGENSMDTLRETTNKPRVLIGGAEATLLFSGLSPQFTGLYQINVRVPEGIPPGDVIPVQVEIGGAQSRSDVTLAIRP